MTPQELVNQLDIEFDRSLERYRRVMTLDHAGAVVGSLLKMCVKIAHKYGCPRDLLEEGVSRAVDATYGEKNGRACQCLTCRVVADTQKLRGKGPGL